MQQTDGDPNEGARPTEDPGRMTRLLNRFGRGEPVEDELLATAYVELRQLAALLMRGQNPGHTLQPTALIHEAWMRLARQEELEFDGRAQFFQLASRVMRSVLVDHARAAIREKRGGGRARITLDPAMETDLVSGTASTDLLDLEDALQRLEAIRPELARIVEMRFFGGLSHPEIASSTGLALRTVERNWRTARAWLLANFEASRE